MSLATSRSLAAFWLVKSLPVTLSLTNSTCTVVHIFVQLKKSKLVLYLACAVLWETLGAKGLQSTPVAFGVDEHCVTNPVARVL